MRTPYCFGSVEVGSFVFNIVYLGEKETQGALKIMKLRC
jgi:hypothetical protein